MTTQLAGTLAQPIGLYLHGEHDLNALHALADPSQLTTLELRACSLLGLA